MGVSIEFFICLLWSFVCLGFSEIDGVLSDRINTSCGFGYDKIPVFRVLGCILR